MLKNFHISPINQVFYWYIYTDHIFSVFYPYNCLMLPLFLRVHLSHKYNFIHLSKIYKTITANMV